MILLKQAVPNKHNIAIFKALWFSKGDGTESLGYLFFKKLVSFGNGRILGFWKYHSRGFWASFGDLRALGEKMAIIKTVKIVIKQLSLYYNGEVYAKRSKIAKNHSKSMRVVFSEFLHFQNSPTLGKICIFSIREIIFLYRPLIWQKRDPRNFGLLWSVKVGGQKHTSLPPPLTRYDWSKCH